MERRVDEPSDSHRLLRLILIDFDTAAKSSILSEQRFRDAKHRAPEQWDSRLNKTASTEQYNRNESLSNNGIDGDPFEQITQTRYNDSDYGFSKHILVCPLVIWPSKVVIYWRAIL